MSSLNQILDFFLHLDQYLNFLIQTYGGLTYAILFGIIFAETGLVIAPILPGDSLLFGAGAFAALGSLDVWMLFFLLTTAAILGDSVNYWIGYHLGPKVFKKENSRFFKKEYLEQTEKFYQKHGGKTIIIARFMPIIRTFAPFVAGIGKMHYTQFISYNILGGILWIGLFTFGGYFFGNVPIIKNNFTVVILAIIVLSILPGIYKFIQHRLRHPESPNN